ncbi:MAG: hypothetical protein AB7S26_12245 [Sandaracinaceae bacterium]
MNEEGNVMKDPGISAATLETVAIDAINIFCREVLVGGGFLSAEHWENAALLPHKYQVARTVASQHAASIDDDGETD